MATIDKTDRYSTQDAWQAWGEALHATLAPVERAGTVVLLPFIQLCGLARDAWQHALTGQSSLSPQFETTRNWAARLARAPQPLRVAAQGFQGQRRTDELDARRFLLNALEAKRGVAAAAADASIRSVPLDALVDRLLLACAELAPLVAAQPPAQRAAWGQTQIQTFATHSPGGSVEGLLGRYALEWLAHSRFETDVLHDPQLWSAAPRTGAVHTLVVVPGVQGSAALDPLTAQIMRAAGDAGARVEVLGLPAQEASADPNNASLIAFADESQEARGAAALAMRALNSGPLARSARVALVAQDRTLVRAASAMLAQAGLSVTDETGWRLATTRSAVQWRALERVCSPSASGSDVLTFLHTNSEPQDALGGLQARLALAHLLRRARVRLWSAWHLKLEAQMTQMAPDGPEPSPREHRAWEAAKGLHALRAPWLASSAAQPIAHWLALSAQSLQQLGWWAPMAQDSAGAQLLDALALTPQTSLGEAAQEQLDAREFWRWAQRTLEHTSFRPPRLDEDPMVASRSITVLPAEQLWGRTFDAVVFPGADAQCLPLAPEASGFWSPSQRQTLGLPSTPERVAAQTAVLGFVRGLPALAVCWRKQHQGADVGHSHWVQGMLESGVSEHDAQTVWARTQLAASVPPVPRPQGAQVAAVAQPKAWSASSYEALRQCPYRFFAMRGLGLQELEDPEREADARDWGQWLHEVFQRFHPTGSTIEPLAPEARAAHASALEAIAQSTLAAMPISEQERSAYAAAWTRVRERYLDHLAQLTETAVVEAVEHEARRALGNGIELFGRIDRIDRIPGGGGGAFVVWDYKTKSNADCKKLADDTLEAPQLPLYAALVAGTSQAAYLSLAEGKNDEVKALVVPHLEAHRQLVLQGLVADHARLEGGEALLPLGEGRVCETCAARGLCRKDFWAGTSALRAADGALRVEPPEAQA